MANIDEVLQEIVRRITEVIKPDKIILFGSQARGDAGPDSDVDLLIIAPSSEPRLHRARAVLRALRGIGVPKDVVWYTQDEVDEWRNVRSHFVNRALREGRLIYESPS
ncbi:MAG: nucleotidyltransferase domain-containing protein [Armatimonadia bacterium]